MSPVDASIATIICAAIAAIGGVAGTVISSRTSKAQVADKADRERRQRETDDRDKELHVALQCSLCLLQATADATKVLLLSARGDHVNGNVEDALRRLDDAGNAYSEQQDHLTTVALTGRGDS